MDSTVKSSNGWLEGFVESGVHKFLGIPYAEPPVESRRWCSPVALAAWDGYRMAKRFGPACVQTVGAAFTMRNVDQSEDCLYLNVWTATIDPQALQPVMVWIHGGGNLGGSGSEDAYDGSRLAAKGVTAVTLNYRLGAFGFLAHPDMGANFAVLDIVAALQWVRANIIGFGGNPEMVTIFGQSAGAVAVRSLLSCPMARGLFQRAIMQSAGFEPPASAPSWSYARAQAAAEQLFDHLGTRDPEQLRAAPTASVKLASHELSGIFPQPGRVHTPANLVWMPVIDGKTVVQDDYPGWAERVPLMLGCVENEARYFLKPQGSYPPEILRNMATALCGSRADAVLALLEAEGLSTYEALDRLYTAVIWSEPASTTLARFAAMGRSLYYYKFCRFSPGSVISKELAKHTSEIRYIFGNLTEDGAYDAIDRRVSDLMQDAWIAFARTGVPQGPTGSPWPCYVEDAPAVSMIGDFVETTLVPVDQVVSAIHTTRGEC